MCPVRCRRVEGEAVLQVVLVLLFVVLAVLAWSPMVSIVGYGG